MMVDVALLFPTSGKLLPDIVVRGLSRPWQPSRRARAGVRNATTRPVSEEITADRDELRDPRVVAKRKVKE